MFRNYLKTAWRNLRNQKTYSILNVAGLATGMAVALLIGLWVYEQFSYDRFLPGYDTVYKAGKLYVENGSKQVVNFTPQPLADALKKHIPGVKYAAHTDAMKSHSLMVGDRKVYLPGGMVDTDFLNIFPFPFVHGDRRSALSDPYSIVLTEATAQALFGTENPLNRMVRIDNEHTLKVTGILRNVPANSTLQFNFLVPFAYFEQNGPGVKDNAGNWTNSTVQTYIALQAHVSPEQIGPQLRKIFARYDPDDYKRTKSEVLLQPARNWHLYADYENGQATGFIAYVKLFALIGAFVLLIACVNFVNLSTASSEKRAKEVGLRKTIGSLRSQLIMQFLTESVLLAGIAFVLCIVMTQLALPAFNTVAQSDVQIPYTNLFFWLLMAVYVLATGLLAGSRPAFYLSGFTPVAVLKGIAQSGSSSLMRRMLVVLQFTCSVGLIIGTMTIYRQIRHAKDRPTGYDTGRLLMTDASADTKRNFAALKNELLQSGVVDQVTQSSSPVTQNTNYNAIMQWKGQLPGEELGIASVAVGDPDYFPALGMQISAGRNFTGENDSANVVINEAAAEKLRLKNPVNQIISWGGGDRPVRIIAVVKNALMESPFEKAKPMLFAYYPGRARVITFRLRPGAGVTKSLEQVQAVFSRYNPSVPFSYRFVDEAYAAKFRVETLTGTLAGLFAALAVFISCLGLFGLTAYTAEMRKKEIGIRKVLGATVSQVWLMLSGGYLRLILLSCLIASLIAVPVLSAWLQHYEYRIALSAGVFLIASLSAVGITLITISFQAVKAALANPVRSLRSE